MFEFLQEWTIYQIVTFTLLVVTALVTTLMGLKRLYNWYKRRQEKKEYDKIMEDPLEVHFFIPALEKFKIAYEKQEQDRILYPKYELEIPKGIEDVIFLRILPRINARVGDKYCGFDFPDPRKKPEIFYFQNPFVKETSFQRDWYKDWDGYVHSVEEQIWRKDEIYVSAYKIKTYDKGDYTFYMFCHLSCNEYKSIKEERHTVARKKLKIKVK